MPPLPITTASDYLIKPFRISQDGKNKDLLNGLIPTVERRVLRDLLGDDTYVRVKDSTPLKEQDEALINGYEYTDNDGVKRVNVGLKTIIQYFVYYDFVSDNWINTVTGNVQNVNENSKALLSEENTQVVNNRYNQGVKLFNEDILMFLDEFAEITGAILTAVDNADNTYDLTIDGIDSTNTFLQAGDIFVVDGVVGSIVSVAGPTAFVFDAGAIGLLFTGENYSYENFTDLVSEEMGVSWL